MEPTLSPLQKFGEWLPDKGALNNPGAFEARNVVPAGDDYGPVETVTEDTDAIPSECLGVFGCYDKTGTPFTFAGTTTKLYRLSGTSWVDVSKSGGYTTSGENRWRFVQYGDYVLATNFNDNVQVFNLGTSSAFADLAGSPPRCKWLTVVNNFLMAVNTYDGTDGAVNFRVWWSGLDNITVWTPNIQTQADRQDTPGYGQCSAVVGSQNTALMFLTEGIYRLDYVGPSTIFNFTLVEPNRGTLVAGSVAAYSNFVFYLGEDGFNMFNGQSSQSIGNEKVDNWFKARVDNNNLFKMQAAINPRRKQVIWAFPSAGGNGVCDTLLIYNWASNRWSYVEQPVQAMSRVYSQAVLSDNLSILSDSLDTLSDGASYAGRRALLGVIGAGRKLGFFSGANRTGVIETKEVRLNDTGRAYVGSVFAVVDCSTVSVELLTRDNQTVAASSAGVMTPEVSTGEANFHVDSIFQRVRVTLSGDWKRAQGVQVAYVPSGR